MNKNNLVPVSLLTNWNLLDHGNFGSVYKAKHTGLNLDVAVKKLKRNLEHGLKALIAEAEKMASASSSPFVIRLYGILEKNLEEPPGIVMEYMEYGSLWTLMEKVGPLPWALKFRILHEVTLGMNWLHNLSTPLLHLDLKTKNILLNEELHIKITDFGLSKYTSGSSIHGPQDCEGVGGTLEYMPPEAFQEGYQPSTSTDVYSFAILSAVVLRGQNPYPVDKSVLIRELVPRGQRPCLQALEKEASVTYLNEAIDFTKLCWDNDKFRRPHFKECCVKWETFHSAYKCDVRQAVREVQDKMDSSVSSGKATGVLRTEDTFLNTNDMSEMVHKFRTMNVSGGPCVLQEAVPVMNSQNLQSQPTRVHPETSEQGHLQATVGSNFRSQSTCYPAYAPVMSFEKRHARAHPSTLPQSQPQPAMGSNYRPQRQNYPGTVPFWYQRSPSYLQNPDFPQPFQSNPAAINIVNSSNFQIGNNTIMNVTNNPHPGSYQNIIYRQPVHTVRRHYPPLMSPQPQHSTQGYYNLSSRPAAFDQPCKQETVVKSDQQFHSCSRTIPEGHSSDESKVKLIQGTMSTTVKPTTKHPGQ